MWGERNMCQRSRFNLEDDVRQLPGRDASLTRVHASDGVPMQTKAHLGGDNFAITITQCHRT